jgi:probable HAF family extracellular repeat protein
MRIRRDLSVLVLGMSLLQFIMPQAPWAAQSYTIQELGVADAIRAAGPNLGGQVAVRSGFVSATSRRITPGGRAARDRRLALDENIKESEIDDAGEVDVVDGRSAGRGGTLDVDDYVSANGINDLGNVVGSANTSFGSRPCRDDIPGLLVDDIPGIRKPFFAPPPGDCQISTVRAVLWTKRNGLRDLGTLAGGNASEAFGINNFGAIVGYSNSSDGVRAFVWAPDGKQMQGLAPLAGGEFSKAFAINDTGLIVGSSGSPLGTRATLWSGGRIRNLGALPGETFSEAHAINASGAVVGSSRGPAGMRAFLWESGKGMQVLRALTGGRFSTASGINDSGDIVGSAESTGGIRAVLWSTGREPQDLNALAPVPSGLVLMEAVGINESGQIAVLARDQRNIHANHEGTSRAFVLTPSGP